MLECVSFCTFLWDLFSRGLQFEEKIQNNIPRLQWKRGSTLVVLASVLRRDGNQSWANGAPRLRKL